MYQWVILDFNGTVMFQDIKYIFQSQIEGKLICIRFYFQLAKRYKVLVLSS